MNDKVKLDERLRADAERYLASDPPPPSLDVALEFAVREPRSMRRRNVGPRLAVAAVAVAIASAGVAAATNRGSDGDSARALRSHRAHSPGRAALVGYRVLGPPHRAAEGRLVLDLMAFSDQLSAQEATTCTLLQQDVPTERRGLTISATIPAVPNGNVGFKTFWRWESVQDMPNGPLNVYECPAEGIIPSPSSPGPK